MNLVQLHADYIAGLMSFAAFAVAFTHAMNTASKADIDKLRSVAQKPYREIFDWENDNELSRFHYVA